jgi:hypothetical protein
MEGLLPGWTSLELRQHQWTGNSGCPLFGAELHLPNLRLRRNVRCADGNPTVTIFCGIITLDHSFRHHMHKAPAVIGTRDRCSGQLNRLLAVWAEHFVSRTL